MNFILQDRSLVVRQPGLLPDAHDAEAVRQACPGALVYTDRQTGACITALPAEAALPEGFVRQPLRQYFAQSSPEAGMLAFRAKALAEWAASTRYCPRCGAALEEHSELIARQCPDCGQLMFPRIDPCIIVVVKKEGKILLARHVQRNQDIYACIAGFVEAGESAEHAVEREVYEETGIRVKNIRYQASQSWPFPGQLMLGFTAEYAGGGFRLQPDEIADAGWFDPDCLPPSPSPGSLAYRLIHEFV